MLRSLDDILCAIHLETIYASQDSLCSIYHKTVYAIHHTKVSSIHQVTASLCPFTI